MAEPGNIDLTKRPRVKNRDGSVSTVRSISFQDDAGKEVLIPTVTDDGRILSDKQAIDLYYKTGEHLGKFDTPDEATAFAQSLHESEAAKLEKPMADNRKKKPNYADALAAPAKSSPAQEQIEVDVGGEVVPILRGDMTDAQWAAVKKRALPKGSDVSLKSKELGWSDLMSLGQNLDGVADTVVSKEQKDLLKKTDEWTRAEYLRQRFRQQGYTVPPNSADDERASYKDGKKAPPVDVGAKKPDQGSPEEWKAMPAAKPQPQSAPGTQTEDDAMVGSAGPGMSPRANMMQMALAANPTGEQTLTGQSTEEIDRDLANVKAQGERHGQEDLAAIKAAVGPAAGRIADGLTGKPIRDAADRLIGGGSIVPQDVKDFAAAVPGTAAQWTGTLMSGAGDIAGMPNLSAAGERVYANGVQSIEDAARMSGEQQARQAMGVGAGEPLAASTPTPAQPPVPQEQGQGSLAASIAGSMPGGFREATVDPARKAQSDELVKRAIEGSTALQKSTDDTIKAQQQLLDESVRLQREKMDAAEVLAKEAADIQRTHAEEAARMTGAKMRVLEQARAAAATPTDPNRYWNNKSDGQRAAAVIAGALFGWGGQGMQWLQRLDGLVEADMNAQRADRASKVQGLNAEAQGYGEAAREALANGATLAEAKLIEKAAKFESAKAYIDQFAMQTQNAQMKLRALEMSQGAADRIAGLGMQMEQLAQGEANMKNHARAQNAQLMQSKMSAMAKLAAGGGNGGEQLRGPQVQNINDMMDAIKSAKNMSAEFKDKASGLVSKLTALDPTGSTGASEYNAKRDVVVQLVGRALEGGVLREGDIARYQKMIPAAGDLRGDERWNQLIKELEQRLATNLQGFANAGFDVGGLPRQASGVLTPAVPSYAKPR